MFCSNTVSANPSSQQANVQRQDGALAGPWVMEGTMRPQRFVSRTQVLAFAIALCIRTIAYADNDSDLRDAAKRGDVDSVKSLLGKGANVNSKDSDGRTALLEAAYWG